MNNLKLKFHFRRPTILCDLHTNYPICSKICKQFLCIDRMFKNKVSPFLIYYCNPLPLFTCKLFNHSCTVHCISGILSGSPWHSAMLWKHPVVKLNTNAFYKYKKEQFITSTARETKFYQWKY